MWPDLIQKAKEGGLDVIQTYVFWNGHEPEPGKVNQTYLFFFSFFSIDGKYAEALFFTSLVLFWGEIWSGQVC